MAEGEALGRTSNSDNGHSNRQEDWFQLISEDWTRLSSAPVAFRSNPEIVGQAVRMSNGEALLHASEVLRADTEFVLGAIQELGVHVLEHAAPHLKANTEFMMEVVDTSTPADVLPYVSAALRKELLADSEFLLEVIRQTGIEVLEEAPAALRGDRDFMLAVAEICPGGEALAFASEDLRSKLYSDKAFVLSAVVSSGADVLDEASEVLRSDREFILACAERSSLGEVLQHASEELQLELDPQGLLVREFRRKRRRLLAINRKRQSTAPDAECVELSSSDEEKDIQVERKAVMKKVREHGIEALEKASFELKDNRDFMLACTAYCSPYETLQRASRRLQTELCANSKFVLRLVEEVGGRALMHASMRLRSNSNFMMTAADSCSTSEILEHASADLRTELYADSEFVLRHITESGGAAALQHASDSLRGDREFVLACVKFCSLEAVLPHITQELRQQLDPSMKPVARPSKSARLQASREETTEVITSREQSDVVDQSKEETAVAKLPKEEIATVDPYQMNG